jgi:hypothetical protein
MVSSLLCFVLALHLHLLCEGTTNEHGVIDHEIDRAKKKNIDRSILLLILYYTLSVGQGTAEEEGECLPTKPSQTTSRTL